MFYPMMYAQGEHCIRREIQTAVCGQKRRAVLRRLMSRTFNGLKELVAQRSVRRIKTSPTRLFTLKLIDLFPCQPQTSLGRRLTRCRRNALGSLVALWARSRRTAAFCIWLSYCVFYRTQAQARVRTQILRRCDLILKRGTARACLAHAFHTWRVQMRTSTPKASQTSSVNTATTGKQNKEPSSKTGWTWTPTQVTDILMQFCDRTAIDVEKKSNNDAHQNHGEPDHNSDAVSRHSPFDQMELTRMIVTLQHWQQQLNPRPSPNDRVHQITLS